MNDQAQDGLAHMATTIALLDVDASRDHVLEVFNRVRAAKARIRDLDAMLREQLVAWLEHNGPIDVGDQTLYAAPRKDVTVRSKYEATEAVLDAIGGDLTKFVELLVAQPLKHGAAKKVLGDDYEKHFHTAEVLDVKQKPVKEIRLSDRKYLKP